MRATQEGKYLTSSKRDPAFISRGFMYWKEATVAFKKHHCHREANEAIVFLPKTVGNVGEILSIWRRKPRIGKCFLEFCEISGI